MNEVEPIFCFVSKEKKTNPRILLASSYRLTKIWTVKFKFFLQRQKMPELIPGERGTVMGGKAAGRESQLFFHARHCSLWGRLTCVYGRSEKKWTKKAAQSVEFGTAYRFAQFFIFLFFFSTEVANKPAETTTIYLRDIDIDTSSLFPGFVQLIIYYSLIYNFLNSRVPQRVVISVL